MLYLPIVLIVVFGVTTVDVRPVPDITTTGPVLPKQPPNQHLPVSVSVMAYGYLIVVVVVLIQCRIAIIQILEPEFFFEKNQEFTEKYGWLYPSVYAAIVVVQFVGIEVLIHYFLGYLGGEFISWTATGYAVIPRIIDVNQLAVKTRHVNHERPCRVRQMKVQFDRYGSNEKDLDLDGQDSWILQKGSPLGGQMTKEHVLERFSGYGPVRAVRDDENLEPPND